MCATVKRLQAVNIFCSNFIICLLVFFLLINEVNGDQNYDENFTFGNN